MLSLTSQEVSDPPAGGERHIQLGELDLKESQNDCVKRRAKVHKQDPGIGSWGVQMEVVLENHADDIVCRSVHSVGKLPWIQYWVSEGCEVMKHKACQCIHDGRSQGNGSVVRL